MYPDTDTPPLPVRDELIESVRSELPEAPWDRENRYEALGLSPRGARTLARASWAYLFDEVAPTAGRVARRVAGGLGKRIPHLRRAGHLNQDLPPERLAALVRAMEREVVRLEAFERILDDLVKNPDKSEDEILGPYMKSENDLESLEQALPQLLRRTDSELETRSPSAAARWGMGKLMRRFLGRLAPRHVEERWAATLRAAGWEVGP
jgi:aspartyl-tRNA(Asn)/glutamyl-tRNA(Gln) amidotransferase subunit B